MGGRMGDNQVAGGQVRMPTHYDPLFVGQIYRHQPARETQVESTGEARYDLPLRPALREELAQRRIPGAVVVGREDGFARSVEQSLKQPSFDARREYRIR